MCEAEANDRHRRLLQSPSELDQQIATLEKQRKEQKPNTMAAAQLMMASNTHAARAAAAKAAREKQPPPAIVAQRAQVRNREFGWHLLVFGDYSQGCCVFREQGFQVARSSSHSSRPGFKSPICFQQ